MNKNIFKYKRLEIAVVLFFALVPLFTHNFLRNEYGSYFKTLGEILLFSSAINLIFVRSCRSFLRIWYELALVFLLACCYYEYYNFQLRKEEYWEWGSNYINLGIPVMVASSILLSIHVALIARNIKKLNVELAFRWIDITLQVGCFLAAIVMDLIFNEVKYPDFLYGFVYYLPVLMVYQLVSSIMNKLLTGNDKGRLVNFLVGLVLCIITGVFTWFVIFFLLFILLFALNIWYFTGTVRGLIKLLKVIRNSTNEIKLPDFLPDSISNVDSNIK